ncbi:MAG: hydroxymethylglutaryl-CoA reductase, degradative [Anaerolineae bacterium]|nr:hydroxymethylglutaryl-CoA reductase, degradative [Anaerolineae bacterium]
MTKAGSLAGFYKLDQAERRQKLAEYAGLTEEDLAVLQAGLSAEQAEVMIENVVGRYVLPLGIATNFLINQREVLVPMVVEEPSVVAGASYAAKVVRAGGGFQTGSTEPVMIGQIQVLDLTDLDEAVAKLKAAETDLLAVAGQSDPIIQKLGGGARGLEYRPLPDTPAGPMLIIHLLYDCRDAMGANMVNTAAETLAPHIEQITGGRVNLRILSNLADRRTARAECLIPVEQLARAGLPGAEVAQAIFEAWAFAAADPYRAATHNKGVMNGIDAVALATGNDWRAIEAGAHTYAARNGRPTSLTEWSLVTAAPGQKPAHLRGVLEMPMAVGTVGGATKAHPIARVALKILGQPNAAALAEIMVAVGLAQNLAAIWALATEGIQRGHMRLHARQVALAAGAQGTQVQKIASQLVAEGKINETRARELLAESQE